MCEVNPLCAITANESLKNEEIRTKVFRIGAPLLRSTIPVPLGRSSTVDSLGGICEGSQTGAAERPGNDEMETVLSLSDVESEDPGQLSITLDFPC